MENLIKVCKELKRATLKARELGVIGISELYDKDSKEQYQVFDEQVFVELSKDKLVEKTKHSSDYNWKYTVEVDGLTFFTITNEELEI